MFITCRHCNGKGTEEIVETKYCSDCIYVSDKNYCHMGVKLNITKKHCKYKKLIKKQNENRN